MRAAQPLSSRTGTRFASQTGGRCAWPQRRCHERCVSKLCWQSFSTCDISAASGGRARSAAWPRPRAGGHEHLHREAIASATRTAAAAGGGAAMRVDAATLRQLLSTLRPGVELSAASAPQLAADLRAAAAAAETFFAAPTPAAAPGSAVPAAATAAETFFVAPTPAAAPGSAVPAAATAADMPADSQGRCRTGPHPGAAAPAAAPAAAEPPPAKRQKAAAAPFDFARFRRRPVVLRLLYIGWSYHGFPSQDDSDNTVEWHLFRALERTRLLPPNTAWADVNYTRCGRTDVGVSATGQILTIDLRSKAAASEASLPEPSEELDYPFLLNRVLPDDIQVGHWGDPRSSNLTTCLACPRSMS